MTFFSPSLSCLETWNNLVLWSIPLLAANETASRLGLVKQKPVRQLAHACLHLSLSGASYSCLLARVYMMGAEINKQGHIPIEILPCRSLGPEKPSPDVTKVLISVQAVVEATYGTWWCLFLPQDDGQLGLVTLEDHPLYPMLQTITLIHPMDLPTHYGREDLNGLKILHTYRHASRGKGADYLSLYSRSVIAFP